MLQPPCCDFIFFRRVVFTNSILFALSHKTMSTWHSKCSQNRLNWTTLNRTQICLLACCTVTLTGVQKTMDQIHNLRWHLSHLPILFKGSSLYLSVYLIFSLIFIMSCVGIASIILLSFVTIFIAKIVLLSQRWCSLAYSSGWISQVPSSQRRSLYWERHNQNKLIFRTKSAINYNSIWVHKM